jgi:HK97 family phage portal protein
MSSNNPSNAQQPGSVVLSRWLAGRENGFERAGVQPVQSRSVSTADSREMLMDFFGVPNSAAGVPVTATTAQRVSAVSACVALIAGGVSTMPLKIYRRTLDASGRYQREEVDGMDLFWLLNEQPCAAFTAADHWNLSIKSKLLRGSGYTYMSRKNNGYVAEFLPLDWAAVTAKRRDNGRLMYVVNDGLMAKTVDQDDMLHFAGFGFDGEEAPSVIQYAARQAVGNALAMDEYSGKFFANGAHHSLLLETDKKMTESAVNALQAAVVNKFSGLDNAHRMPLVLTEGIKAKEVSLSASDAQLLEARRFQVVDVCRAFGVPPHMVGEATASAWGSGLESLRRSFVAYTLELHLRPMEQELNRKLFRRPDFFVEFDRTAAMAGDSKAQADYFRAAMGGPGSGAGWMKPNEARRAMNLPPVDGGNTLYMPPPPAGQTTPGAPAP